MSANVADVVSRHAQATPRAPAVVERGRVIDYRAFDHAIWRAAAQLRRQGIAPGDVVGVTMGSSTLHLVAGYALARMGAVQLSLSLRESEATRRSLAQRFHAAALVTDKDADPAWLAPDDSPIDRAVRAPGGDAGWKIAMTSGTTGTPKAVLQTHAMHIAWRELNQAAVPLQPDECYLAVVELDFFAGFRLCMDVHWSGGAVLVGEAPRTVDALLETIERDGVNYLYLTPVHLQQLLPRLPADRPRLPGLRRLRTGSMIVGEALRGEIVRRLTPNLVVAYGTNDVGSPFTLADGDTLQRFPDSIGFPVRGVEVEVVNEEGRALPAGETGLVRVKTPGMPAAYLGNPEASARAFRDGWYYPGDLGVLAPEGALYFKGRADDLMNFDGIKIYPAEIEAVLLAHPAVAEAAAFPIASRRHQDVPAAAVVLREKLDTQVLERHCRERLGVRAPRIIAALSELPRNAAGKVLKRELAQALARRLADEC